MNRVDLSVLDGVDLVELLEYVAARSRNLRDGERELHVVFSNGKVRRSFVKLGPIRPDELADCLG